MKRKKNDLLQKLHSILDKIKIANIELQTYYEKMQNEIIEYIKEYNFDIEENYLSFIIMDEYQKIIQKIYQSTSIYIKSIEENIKTKNQNYFTEVRLSMISNDIKENINKSFENNNIDDIINNQINAILIRHASGNLKFARNVIKIRKEIQNIIKENCMDIELHLKTFLENDVIMIANFEKKKKKIAWQVFRYSFLTCSIVIGSTIIYNIYSLHKDTQKSKAILSSISTKVDLKNRELNVVSAAQAKTELEKLKEMNPDSVSWIVVKGTNINHSVVKAQDNDFYLNHNFYKEYSENGWPFMDYRNSGNFDDKNTIIYAHNTMTMFATLRNTLSNDWINNKENRYITTVTQNGILTWEVFSTYTIKAEEYYIKTKFTGSEFKNFIKTLKNRSVYNYGVEVNDDDRILTLSTCNKSMKNGRTVLHAKLVQ